MNILQKIQKYFLMNFIFILVGCNNPLGTENEFIAGDRVPTNTAPTLTSIADQNIIKNASSNSLTFTISDSENNLNCETSVSMTSSNSTVIDNTDVVFSGTAPDCTAVLNPNADQIGSATITLTVSDELLQNSIEFNISTISALTLNSGSFEYVGGTQATSCLAYLNHSGYSSEGSGTYWIDPDGAGGAGEIEALCDMTSNGGGWTLLSNRSGGTVNVEDCGANLNEFFQSTCGNVNNITFLDSYSIGNSGVRSNIVTEGDWKFMQYTVGDVLDSNDAHIIHNDGTDLFFDSINATNKTLVTSVCDINDANCDTTNVYYLWAGNGWWGSAKCNSGFSTGQYLGNHGYCHDGVSNNYDSNGLFGNRSGYNETKLWNHNNGAKAYQERIWAR
jgi:hypothetical protein